MTQSLINLKKRRDERKAKETDEKDNNPITMGDNRSGWAAITGEGTTHSITGVQGCPRGNIRSKPPIVNLNEKPPWPTQLAFHHRIIPLFPRAPFALKSNLCRGSIGCRSVGRFLYSQHFSFLCMLLAKTDSVFLWNRKLRLFLLLSLFLSLSVRWLLSHCSTPISYLCACQPTVFISTRDYTSMKIIQGRSAPRTHFCLLLPSTRVPT